MAINKDTYQSIVKIGTDAGYGLGVDNSTQALETVDYAHHEIHSGSSYSACYVNDAAASAFAKIFIQTPNTTKWDHLTFSVDAEDEVEVTLYEAATAAGTTVGATPINRNRNSSKVSGTNIYTSSAITATTSPTLLCKRHLASVFSTGKALRQDDEFVLKQNTTYALQAENVSAGASQISINANWYEHTDKV